MYLLIFVCCTDIISIKYVGGQEVIMNYKQLKATDYVENQDILNALGIKNDADSSKGKAPTVSSSVYCRNDRLIIN